MQNAKLLEKLDLGPSKVELHDILYPPTRTIKVLDFTVSSYDESLGLPLPLSLGRLCDKLEVMAGHNILEALFFEVNVDGYGAEKFVGSIIQNMVNVLGGLRY